jgi:hypothetical protein
MKLNSQQRINHILHFILAIKKEYIEDTANTIYLGLQSDNHIN